MSVIASVIDIVQYVDLARLVCVAYLVLQIGGMYIAWECMDCPTRLTFPFCLLSLSH